MKYENLRKANELGGTIERLKQQLFELDKAGQIEIQEPKGYRIWTITIGGHPNDNPLSELSTKFIEDLRVRLQNRIDELLTEISTL